MRALIAACSALSGGRVESAAICSTRAVSCSQLARLIAASIASLFAK